MARLICLYVEDNDQAQTLIDDMLAYPDARLLTPAQENDIAAIPVALFAVPTLFCECPERFGDSKMTGYRIARGAKLGWWVHDKCGKPRVDQWQSPRNMIGSTLEAHTRYHVNWTFKPPLMTSQKDNAGEIPAARPSEGLSQYADGSR